MPYIICSYCVLCSDLDFILYKVVKTAAKEEQE